MYALPAASFCASPIVKVAVTAMPPALPNLCFSATTQECGFIAEVVDNFFHYGSHSEERLGPVRQQVGDRLQLMGVGDVELYNYTAVLLTARVPDQSGASGQVRVPTTSESAQRLVATSFSLHTRN